MPRNKIRSTDTPPDASSLPNPFPRHPAPHSVELTYIPIYARWPHTQSNLPPGKYPRTIVEVFAQPYSALHFVQLFLQKPNPHDPEDNTVIELSYKWLDHHTILIPETDVTLSTRTHNTTRRITLEDVLEHTCTKAELQYHLPEAIQRQSRLLTRPFGSDPLTGITQTTDPDDPNQPLISTDTDSRTRKRSASGSSRQKLDRTGLHHVSVISTKLNILPREARQALRASKTPKPKGGWWFTTEQLPQMEQLILKHLKKPKSSK